MRSAKGRTGSRSTRSERAACHDVHDGGGCGRHATRARPSGRSRRTERGAGPDGSEPARRTGGSLPRDEAGRPEATASSDGCPDITGGWGTYLLRSSCCSTVELRAERGEIRTPDRQVVRRVGAGSGEGRATRTRDELEARDDGPLSLGGGRRPRRGDRGDSNPPPPGPRPGAQSTTRRSPDAPPSTDGDDAGIPDRREAAGECRNGTDGDCQRTTKAAREPPRAAFPVVLRTEGCYAEPRRKVRWNVSESAMKPARNRD